MAPEMPGPVVKWDKRVKGWWLVFLAAVLISVSAPAATTIQFTLDEPCKTSAGVYAPGGTLVRTLWSNVPYRQAGTYSATWDGNDDNGNAVAAGTYTVKIAEHNVRYVWDGAIGNTSAQAYGCTVHSAFYTMHDMTVSGTNAFYVTGYNEGKFDFAGFSTADPQTVLTRWNPANGYVAADIYDCSWSFAASDSNWVYFAAPSSTSPTNPSVKNYTGFVVATPIGATVANGFTAGVAITNGSYSYPDGVYVGTQAGLSGLAVQANGNLLAVSVAPDNTIYLLDKRSGAHLGSFSVNRPGRLSFDSQGNLWAVSGNNILCYANVNTAPTLRQTIATCASPLAVAVCPTNDNLILVADGGSSQQLKAFTSGGAPLWTYGLAGGYQANGPAVATNKFWFLWDIEMTPATFVCFQPDGSFWVGDGGNHRDLHFDSALNYLGQIMYQPHSYVACTDQNNPGRVFNEFLEFAVDYTQPLASGWTLVNNWMANADSCHIAANYFDGIREVTTLANGRTYGMVLNTCVGGSTFEICELTTNGIRFTGVFPNGLNRFDWLSFAPNGDVYKIIAGAATWYKFPLTGFDASNNPVYGPVVVIASAPSGNSNPVPRCGGMGIVRTTISSNNIVISFDQSLNNGFHLGGVPLGGTNWLWQASPPGPLNNDGHYEISSGTYVGNSVQAVDRQVIFGYHGEFFRNQGEAGQHFHYLDDGLFVGQFGECSIGHNSPGGVTPGFAGNGHSPTLMKSTNGDYYVWVNDESAHGPQRWQLVNAKEIRELTGSGTLNSTIALLSPASGFPTALQAHAGNGRGQIIWTGVSGASSYNVHYSLINGGPYLALSGSTSSTNYCLTGLTNGNTYYVTVTAVVGGVEGAPSEQIALAPFDTSKNVIAAGRADDANVYELTNEVAAGNLASNQPAFLGTDRYVGLRTQQETDDYGFGRLMNENLGMGGYLIFDFNGPSGNQTNLPSGVSISETGGWQDLGYASRLFANSTTSEFNNPAYMLNGNPVGTLSVTAPGTNYYFLSVFSPAKFSDAQQYTITLTSANGDSASYSVDQCLGCAHLFQFLFKGTVTLQANALNGSSAPVQALFLDRATLGCSDLEPPTGFHVISF